MKNIKLDKNIELILKLLQANGQGYIVGGFVRDTLLGIEPKDCDFVTDIEYDKLLKIFKEYSPKEIGRNFGIIQIKIDDIHYEIAKMRQDKGVPEDRKEQEIEFTKDIYEDLKRRDFTINAIAYDGVNFFYGDSFSRLDIEEKKLRFVGQCEKRIEEDPLRILRFFRFLATKDLDYFKETIVEIKKSKELLKKLSTERIREEFNRILVGKNAYQILKLMSKNQILEIIIPEWKDTINFDQKNFHHIYTVDEHILQSLKETEEDLIVRLAIFLHDIGKPRCFTIDENGQGHFYGHEKISAEMSNEILKRLRYDSTTMEKIYKIIKYHMIYRISDENIFIKKMLRRLGKEDIYRYFQVIRADRKARKPPYDLEQISRLEKILEEILEAQLPISLKDLSITGKDLIENGFIQGKEIGEVLNLLLEHVLEHPEYNTREQLLNLALNYKKMGLL